MTPDIFTDKHTKQYDPKKLFRNVPDTLFRPRNQEIDFVEIINLLKIISFVPAHTILLNDQVQFNIIYNLNSSNTISFSDSVQLGTQIYIESVSNSITIIDSVLVDQILNENLTNSISLSDSAIGIITFFGSGNDTISIVDVVDVTFVQLVSITDSISFSDLNNVDHAITTEIDTDSISITDLISLNLIINFSNSDNISFTDSVIEQAIFVKSVTDTISIIDVDIVNYNQIQITQLVQPTTYLMLCM